MKEAILLTFSLEELKGVMLSIVDAALQNHNNCNLNADNDVLSREEALKLLECSSPTLIKFQKDGLPYYRLGKKIYFRKSEILDFAKVSKKGGALK